jgi:uncharacterized protein YoxC
MNEPATLWPIIATIASLFTGIVGGLMIFNLNALKSVISDVKTRQQIADEKIDKLIERKNICNQDYVGKVEYIRSSNGLEDGMKDLIKAVSALSGSMKVMEQMPEICGSITRNVIRELKEGNHG